MSETVVGDTDELPVLDTEQLLDRCMGHIDFAERLLSKFESRFHGDFDQMLQGVADRDPQRVARLAHQMKGAAANVAASRLRRVVSNIEEAGILGALDDIQSRMTELQEEWERFVLTRADRRASPSGAKP